MFVRVVTVDLIAVVSSQTLFRAFTGGSMGGGWGHPASGEIIDNLMTVCDEKKSVGTKS